MRRACVLGLLLWAAPARADLLGDARRLGADDALERRSVFLFPQSVQSASISRAGCGRLIVLGPVGLGFDAERVGAGEPEPPRRSDAGVIDWGTQCGPARVRVMSTSGRGVVEILLLREAPADLYRALGRPAPRPPDFGSPPSVPAPLPEAEARFAAAHRREGALQIEHRQLGDEQQVLRLRLAPGCYELEVVGQGPTTSSHDDIDAELRVVREDEEDRVLAQDRSSATDAALHFCVVTVTDAELRTRGAEGRARRVSYARYALGPSVPEAFGELGVGAVARAWRARGGAHLRLREASFLPPGRSELTQRLASGCYVGALAALDGAPRSVTLRVRGEGIDSRDEARESDLAAMVAFCTDSAPLQIEVDSKGAVPALGLMFYEVPR